MRDPQCVRMCQSYARPCLLRRTRTVGHTVTKWSQPPRHFRRQPRSRHLHLRTTRQISSRTGIQGLRLSGTTVNQANSRGMLFRQQQQTRRVPPPKSTAPRRLNTQCLIDSRRRLFHSRGRPQWQQARRLSTPSPKLQSFRASRGQQQCLPLGSRTVVLDEGGAHTSFHYLILDYDGAPTAPDVTPAAPATRNATPQPPHRLLPLALAPSIPISRPMVHKLNMAFRIKGGPEGATPRHNARVATQDFTRIEGGFVQLLVFATKSYRFHAALTPETEFKLPAAPRDASARRTLDSAARPPSLTKQTIKLNSPGADINAHQRSLPAPSHATSLTLALDSALCPRGPQATSNSSTDEALLAAQSLGKRTLATPAMSGYALALRSTPPGLRGRVGNPAAGDVR